ncbi:hypothetical protein LX87_04799 [Larkinella arboricola]|uniref:DUF3575 domain-containing protein n=1 Tax=Larkinella arboricola TaxID=643671 RepID=A0A327WKN4_LARAB|nr:hypothetical protein [Larkinella arboricola]RAJ92469.1 hypothetical protein LX87_04799 [Larkinella arboricola]
MADRFCKVLVLLFLFSLNGLAQRVLPDTLTPVLNRPPQWVVKFAPLSLIDLDNTIQFGAERLLGRKHAIQAEFGYGWQALNLYPYRRDDYDDFEVWRGRLEWRRYSGRYRSNRRPHYATPPIGRYIAVETFFKQLTVLETTAVGRECLDGTCAYFQQGTFPMYRTVWGAHFKLGRQFVLSIPGENRLLLDFYMGLGFRTLSLFRFSNPANGNDNIVRSTGSVFGWDAGQAGSRLSGTLGIKLGYVL